ncbi:MAG: sulfatase-like hydrolase/transferase [Clostridiales bacterium]|nr:sulfatase-like hydrolase/transferase [Clostridiales bacterium]
MEMEKDKENDTENFSSIENNISTENQLETHHPKKSKKKTFKEKWKDLTRERRSWKIRLLIALLVSFSFAYTLTVFGPFELYLPNMSYYTFSFMELVLPMILVGIGTTAVLTLILMLLRGKFFTWGASAVFSTTVCAYIQGNFLNLDLGALDGTAIAWETFTMAMLVNCIVWAVIFLIPYIVAYFKPKFWRRALVFLSALLIVMQSVALGFLLIKNDFIGNVTNGYLSKSTIYELSPENNVVVFLLDRFDQFYSEEVLNTRPEIKEGLSDFVYYDNVCGSYSRTFPAVTYLLTGVPCKYDIPVTRYFRKAWTEGTFLKDIKDAGYQSKIYTDVNYVIKNVDYATDKIDNIGKYPQKTDTWRMIKAMLTLSAYRYTPIAMKPFFWLYSGDLENITSVDADVSDKYLTDDAGFWRGLKTDKLSIKEDSKGSFVFYHLRGAHDPYVMDENGNTPEGGTGGASGWNAYPQIIGNMNMILEYIQQLKEKGLYEDTTIIITADHGYTGTLEELDFPRALTLMVKPRGANAGEPIQYNSAPLTPENIQATILRDLGIDYEAYGQAVDEVPEDAQITRYFYMSGSDPLNIKRDYNLVTYKIEGDIKDFSNWSIESKERIRYPFYDADLSNE